MFRYCLPLLFVRVGCCFCFSLHSLLLRCSFSIQWWDKSLSEAIESMSLDGFFICRIIRLIFGCAVKKSTLRHFFLYMFLECLNEIFNSHNSIRQTYIWQWLQQKKIKRFGDFRQLFFFDKWQYVTIPINVTAFKFKLKWHAY